MLFAILTLSDFLIIACLIAVLGAGAAASTRGRTADPDLLRRVEQKLDLILVHLGIVYVPPPKSDWQHLASDPLKKIAAIKAYREQHDVGLAEAKKAVEDYIQGRTA